VEGIRVDPVPGLGESACFDEDSFSGGLFNNQRIVKIENKRTHPGNLYSPEYSIYRSLQVCRFASLQVCRFFSGFSTKNVAQECANSMRADIFYPFFTVLDPF
jgi:hypothetical protein